VQGRKAIRTKSIARIVLVLVIPALAMLLLAPESRVGVTAVNASLIDVGQGDSILLRDGNGFLWADRWRGSF
jgi:beta-lactamase superfamily II metal-dependent hydrolase